MGEKKSITGASISFVYSEVYCPWGACLPHCILHLWLLSYQPRLTPNKHCATAKRLHKWAVAGCWLKVGHLCLIGYCGYDIFGRRTSVRKRACRSSMSVAFPTSSLGAMIDLVGCALGERNQRASRQISAGSCPVFREAYLLACRCLHGILLESGAVSPGWFSRNCTTTAYTNACRALPTGGGPPRPAIILSKTLQSTVWCWSVQSYKAGVFLDKTSLGAFCDYDDECCFQRWVVGRELGFGLDWLCWPWYFREKYIWAYEGYLEQWIGRLFHVVSHVMFHVTFAAAAPLFWVLRVLLWLGLFCFGLVFRGSSCRHLFWLSFSRDMTATVLSNAALEKKNSQCCSCSQCSAWWWPLLCSWWNWRCCSQSCGGGCSSCWSWTIGACCSWSCSSRSCWIAWTCCS